MTGALKVQTAPGVWTTIGGGSLVPFASNAETVAGTVTDKAVTPAGLKGAVYNTEPINAARYGYTRAAVVAALDAAEARGLGTVVYFPAGVYELGAGLSLSGYSCQLRGDGTAGTVAAPTGTVFKASTQAGPVLDFTGWVKPATFQTRAIHSGFYVVGSNVADPTKNNSGVRLTSMSSVNFVDIAVRNTGGPCWEHVSNPGSGVYLCDFERIVLGPPVSAKANDVPWMIMNESNGNRFRGFGLRSTAADSDVGASGAIVLQGNASYSAHDNLFDAWWIENLHPPTNGTIFHFAANANMISNFQFFDCHKESGATGTSCYRFVAPAVANYGGNLLTGHIPGRDPGGADSIDMGVDMRQSNNSVRGIKGYRGANVVLDVGVGNTDVELAGAYNGGPDAAVIDNSTMTTNHFADYNLRTETVGSWRRDEGTDGPRFTVAAVPATGNLYLGTSGNGFVSSSTNLHVIATQILLRNSANNGAAKVVLGTGSTFPSINVGNNTPEGVVTAVVGSLFLRQNGGAATTLYVKESGTGNTGWVAK